MLVVEIRSKPMTDSAKRIQIGRFWVNGQFEQPKQRIILEEIAPLFTDAKLKSTLLPFLSEEEGGTAKVSKRDMDWLVTNYCKKFNVQYIWQYKDWSKEVVVLHDKYRTWLRQYKRSLFDIFCRGQRIHTQMGDETYQTTVGQLNFLHWADTYGVLKYLFDHYESISKDHHLRQNQTRLERKQNQGKKRKRQELTPNTQPTYQLMKGTMEYRFV